MLRHVHIGAALAMAAVPAIAAIAPYTADTNTLHLYHFDESAGAADPGTPLADVGSSPYALGNTGGPDGRDNTGIGGYGATTLSGFGSAFSPIASGSNSYHSTTSSVGGGAGGSGAAQLWNTTTGAFTWEALISASAINIEKVIISQDGSTSRGAAFRITTTGQLSLMYAPTSSTVAFIDVPVPTTGDNAFVANEWFHAAVAYNGNAGAAGNVSFYWTRVGAPVTSANLIGTGTLAADLSAWGSNSIVVGGASRSPWRFEMNKIDELRVSGVARSASEFVVVPEPTTLAIVALGAATLLRRRRA